MRTFPRTFFLRSRGGAWRLICQSQRHPASPAQREQEEFSGLLVKLSTYKGSRWAVFNCYREITHLRTYHPYSSHELNMSPVNIPAGKHEYSIACMPADGIGPEVIGAGVEVLKTLSEASGGAFTLTFEDYDWNSENYKKTGKYIPDGGLDRLKKHDAILFGAVGAPGKNRP